MIQTLASIQCGLGVQKLVLSCCLGSIKMALYNKFNLRKCLHAIGYKSVYKI